MKEKSSGNLDTILRVIIFGGVILDTYSVYGFWQQVNDNKLINKTMQENGVDVYNMDIVGMISSLQKGATLLLLVFLIFDFFAYYYLFEYKNWARKYVLSIAVFYLIGCIFDFSMIYFVYSSLTIYYLHKPHKEFLVSRSSHS